LEQGESKNEDLLLNQASASPERRRKIKIAGARTANTRSDEQNFVYDEWASRNA
jgi:hypothetical protein